MLIKWPSSYTDKTFCASPTECIYQFYRILRVNSDYFLEPIQPLDLCNGEVLCFLWSTDRIIIYC
jgi:hypothetical protein